MLESNPLGSAHAIVDLDALPDAAERLDRVRALLAAGLPSLQVRAPGRSTAEIVAVGRELRDAARSAGAFFVVNRDLAAALELEADGLHLPSAGPGPEAMRAEAPPGLAVGTSAHDAPELARAAGADWVFVSPVFATVSKPGAAPLGLAELERLVRIAPAPVLALGGIDLGNGRECFAAGAKGIAAIRGFFGSEGIDLVHVARESTHL